MKLFKLFLFCFSLQAVTAGAASKASTLNSAYAYTVQGMVETRLFTPDIDPIPRFETNQFELQVKDCRWFVKLRPQKSRAYHDYLIVSSDGANTYTLYDYETRVRAEAKKGITHQITNTASGTVRYGNIPLGMEDGALWIAYASGCHFAEDSYTHLRPVPFSELVGPANLEATFWQVLNSPPYLPKTLVYADGNYHPLFTNVVYEPAALTNVEAFCFPKDSTVWRYRFVPGPGAPDAKIQMFRQIRIVATNITLGADLISFKPRLPGLTRILDYRLSDGTPHISHSDTNWPSEPWSSRPRNSSPEKDFSLSR